MLIDERYVGIGKTTRCNFIVVPPAEIELGETDGAPVFILHKDRTAKSPLRPLMPSARKALKWVRDNEKVHIITEYSFCLELSFERLEDAALFRLFWT